MTLDPRSNDLDLRRRVRQALKGGNGVTGESLATEIRRHVDELSSIANTSTSPEELGWVLRAIRHWQETLRLRLDAPPYGARPIDLRAASDLEVSWMEGFRRRVERRENEVFGRLSALNTACWEIVGDLTDDMEADAQDGLALLRIFSGLPTEHTSADITRVLQSLAERKRRQFRLPLSLIWPTSKQDDLGGEEEEESERRSERAPSKKTLTRR